MSNRWCNTSIIMIEYPHLDTSYVPDFFEDRGPAEYFHGRTKVLDNFGKLLERATQTNRGTILLIQGAPGVGKTALLHELEKLALASGWGTTKNKMYPPALWNPSDLRKSLGQKIRAKFSGTGGIGIQVAQIGVKTEWAQTTTLNILGSGKKPLLLDLDEAQTMGTTNAPPSDLAKVATNVLDAIHNGKLGRPVILITAGLGATEEALRSLGISRFKGGCFIELRALGKESERSVILDWLTKDGGAKGDPTAWIDAIAQETHGWPQHITAYGDAAARQIKKDQGRMTPAGLEAVSRIGKCRREAYYKQRVVEFRPDQIRCLTMSVMDIPQGKSGEYRDIISSLTREYDDISEAKKLFDLSIEKGILEKCKTGYAVSIPSMHTWLKEEYGLRNESAS